MESLMPNMVVEWIPYSNLEDIKYLTKGGFSEIYTAGWIDGHYDEWDSEKKQLTRLGNRAIVLKKLENVESANQSWFEEAKSHLTIKMDNLEKNKVEENYTSSRLFTSKIHNFGNLHEPRNATEEEQEAFHSKLYDFNSINDFNKSNEQNSSKSSKVITIFRDSNKKLSKLFKKLQIKSNNDEKEKTQKYVDDDDEVYNNPNLHSKEQDELEIPDDGFFDKSN
ncbi:kinase-like domain-containing protein [Rhizophagus irregularis DAOM 181602=DAOM 197198]|nr:kinase-like domain-containing protein [Rhizophagus irregularis DAOM 181602=DAOM 197198]